MNKAATLVALVTTVALLLAGCTEEAGPTGTPAATPTAQATPQSSPLPSPPPGTVIKPPRAFVTPPMEGPPRGSAATVRTNYRELPEFRLPAPQDLPEAPSGGGPQFQPPAQPLCPPGWQELWRPAEGFKTCYPESWSIDGHGYVSAGRDDRWYSVGLFLYQDDVEVAHVSYYVVNAYARPFMYARDCKQAYRVRFAGEPAILCPDFPGQFNEAKIIAYHVRKYDLDYYVIVVPKRQYNPATGGYLDTWSRDAEATAIQIAHTFQFVERLTPSQPP